MVGIIKNHVNNWNTNRRVEIIA